MTMTITTNVTLSQEAKDLQSRIAGAQAIGAQAYWENRGTVTRQELREAAEKNGVDITIPDPNPESAFKAAVKAVAYIDKDLVARITRDDDVLTFALARVAASDSARVGDNAGEIVNRVLWRKVEEPGRARFAFKVDDDVAHAITDRFDRTMRYMTADELREAVGATIKAIGGIKMLGRLWFVGIHSYHKLMGIKAMVRDVGLDFHIVPILDLGDSQGAMAHIAERQVWHDIKDLQAEVEQWKQGARSPRKSTLEARLATYKDIRDSVENMADVLQMKADDLRHELAAMQQAAMEMLDPTASAKEPATAVPATAAPATGTEEKKASDSANEAATAPPPSRPAPPARPAKPGSNGVQLEELTMKELRRRAKDYGMRPGRLGKEALIAAINELATKED